MHEAALHGSSHYDLPAVMRWFTANIGVHHVHHLCSRIPYYRLPRVLRDHPELKDVGRITLLQSIGCVRLVLWDEDATAHDLVSPVARIATRGHLLVSRPSATRIAAKSGRPRRCDGRPTRSWELLAFPFDAAHMSVAGATHGGPRPHFLVRHWPSTVTCLFPNLSCLGRAWAHS